MHTSRQIPRNTSAKVDCERYTMLENYRAHRCIDPRVKVHIEKGQRTGRCLRHLLALSSSKDKPYILAQRNLFPSRSFFFFLFRLPLFHFREFVSKSCTRIMHLSRDERIFRELARVREKREKNKYLDSCEQIILRQYLINI